MQKDLPKTKTNDDRYYVPFVLLFLLLMMTEKKIYVRYGGVGLDLDLCLYYYGLGLGLDRHYRGSCSIAATTKSPTNETLTPSSRK